MLIEVEGRKFEVNAYMCGHSPVRRSAKNGAFLFLKVFCIIFYAFKTFDDFRVQDCCGSKSSSSNRIIFFKLYKTSNLT